MENYDFNAQGSNKLLTTLFKDHESAEQAYQDLLDQGYEPDDVTLLMADETRERYFSNRGSKDTATSLGNKALEGLGVGGAIGGTLGGLAAAVLAIGTSIVFPGLGLVVAGPLAAGLAGAGAGSVTGGLIGSLIGAGIPSERAQAYEDEIKAGGILLGVTPKNEEDYNYINRQWKKYQSEGAFAA